MTNLGELSSLDLPCLWAFLHHTIFSFGLCTHSFCCSSYCVFFPVYFHGSFSQLASLLQSGKTLLDCLFKSPVAGFGSILGSSIVPHWMHLYVVFKVAVHFPNVGVNFPLQYGQDNHPLDDVDLLGYSSSLSDRCPFFSVVWIL